MQKKVFTSASTHDTALQFSLQVALETKHVSLIFEKTLITQVYKSSKFVDFLPY